jgi:HEAT repeat protein
MKYIVFISISIGLIFNITYCQDTIIPSEQIKKWIEELDNQNHYIISNAVLNLVRMRKIAIPPLLSTLKDQNVGGRKRHNIIWVLIEMKADAEAAIPILVETLKDKDEDIRSFSAHALGKIGTTQLWFLPALCNTLKDKSVKVRLSTAMALGEIGPKAATLGVPALIPLLWDSHTEVVKTVATALGKMGRAADGSVPFLVRIVQEREDYICLKSAITALGEIGSPKAIFPLIEMLDSTKILDSPRIVRLAIVEALGKIGKEAAPSIPKLIPLLIHEHFRPGVYIETLQKIGTKEKIESKELLYLTLKMQDKDPKIREISIWALVEFGPPEYVIPILISALKDSNLEVKISVIVFLGRIDYGKSSLEPFAIKALKELLQHPEPKVREFATASINYLRDKTR